MFERKSAPRKTAGWNHQTELQGNRGRIIHLTMCSEAALTGVVTGELVAADAFTVKVVVERDTYGMSADKVYDTHVIFKHDISSYTFAQ